MKKLINPYVRMEGYNCFGCSPDNPTGLQMQFFDEGEYIISVWKPHKGFQGYKNVLHGGIQVTMMDEIASWVVQTKLGTAGVTSKIETKFIKPIFISEDQIVLKAKTRHIIRNIAVIEVSIFNGNNQLCSQALVSYFTFKSEVAREKYFYPGKDSFYDNTENASLKK